MANIIRRACKGGLKKPKCGFFLKSSTGVSGLNTFCIFLLNDKATIIKKNNGANVEHDGPLKRIS